MCFGKVIIELKRFSGGRFCLEHRVLARQFSVHHGVHQHVTVRESGPSLGKCRIFLCRLGVIVNCHLNIFAVAFLPIDLAEEIEFRGICIQILLKRQCIKKAHVLISHWQSQLGRGLQRNPLLDPREFVGTQGGVVLSDSQSVANSLEPCCQDQPGLGVRDLAIHHNVRVQLLSDLLRRRCLRTEQ